MLTDTKIRKSTPSPKPYRMADGKGLYLVVTPSGGKLWRWKYRFEGSEKLMSFGQYPDVPLVAARERHAEGRRLLAEGTDPMAERKRERAGDTTTFQAVAALWLAHWRVDKSAQHVDSTRRRLEANVYPHLGVRPIEAVLAPELVKMVKAIEERGVGDLAKRALETCGQIFRYGIAHGHCSRNPAAEFKPADVLRPREQTNLARVEAGELPGLLRAIEVYRGSVLTRLAVKLMALTFVRTSELIGARWEEFDLEARRWNIPKERMKMKTPHIVPLSSQAIEVLNLLWTAREYRDGNKVNPEGYLFPGERGSDTMSNNTVLGALRRMGYGGVMTGHGFRGLASTLLHEQGWPHEHIELQLAHAPRNAVSAAYNHALYLSGRNQMMQSWGDYLEAQLRGNRP
jgi:integrase